MKKQTLLHARRQLIEWSCIPSSFTSYLYIFCLIYYICSGLMLGKDHLENERGGGEGFLLEQFFPNLYGFHESFDR